MNKISFKPSWLLVLIPIGILFFVAGPQLQNTYNQFHKKELDHQANVQELDSLKQLVNPTRRDENKIKRLETTVSITGKVLTKQRYQHYKMGGMLVVLAFMFLGMFGSSYWVRRKKKSPKNKVVEFNFEDPNTDAIGQQISWDATENSGSNFLSEHLKKTGFGYKIASSSFMKFVAWSFFLVGVNQLVWTVVEYFQLTDRSLGFMKAGKMFFTSGGVFLIIGMFFIFYTAAKANILMRKRKIVVGGEVLDFNQLYALQVLEKFIEGGSSSSGSYFCYEVNLVTKQGVRYNLLNHGDKVFLLSDMAKLSKILKLPVWNNGVV